MDKYTSEKEIEKARDTKIVALREKGYSYTKIVEKLTKRQKVTPQGAQYIYKDKYSPLERKQLIAEAEDAVTNGLITRSIARRIINAEGE